MADEPVPEDFVIDAHLLVDRMGRWPSFHDAEVRSLHLGIDRSMEVEVYVFTVDGSLDEARYFRMFNPSIVTLAFVEIEDLELNDWNNQNVLNSLSIRPEGDRIAVILGGIFGLSGTFTCASVKVARVDPAE